MHTFPLTEYIYVLRTSYKVYLYAPSCKSKILSCMFKFSNNHNSANYTASRPVDRGPPKLRSRLSRNPMPVTNESVPIDGADDPRNTRSCITSVDSFLEPSQGTFVFYSLVRVRAPGTDHGSVCTSGNTYWLVSV